MSLRVLSETRRRRIFLVHKVLSFHRKILFMALIVLIDISRDTELNQLWTTHATTGLRKAINNDTCQNNISISVQDEQLKIEPQRLTDLLQRMPLAAKYTCSLMSGSKSVLYGKITLVTI